MGERSVAERILWANRGFCLRLGDHIYIKKCQYRKTGTWIIFSTLNLCTLNGRFQDVTFRVDIMIGPIYFPFRHSTTVPSSRGLGRWPLTPETGVRFPLGPPIKSSIYGTFIIFFLVFKFYTPHYTPHTSKFIESV